MKKIDLIKNKKKQIIYTGKQRKYMIIAYEEKNTQEKRKRKTRNKKQTLK